MFSKFKSRRGRLEQSIKGELRRYTPSADNIINAVDNYQKDNVDTIDKLKKEKKVEMNRINGALKQTINAHGPITMALISSASKRIYGSLLEDPNKEEKVIRKISLRGILIGMVLGIVITSMITLIF